MSENGKGWMWEGEGGGSGMQNGKKSRVMGYLEEGMGRKRALCWSESRKNRNASESKVLVEMGIERGWW